MKQTQKIPHNHLGTLSKGLRRFATYLISQRIPFKMLASDYDSPDGTIIIRERYFRLENGKLVSFKPYDYNSKKIHDFMPMNDEIQ